MVNCRQTIRQLNRLFIGLTCVLIGSGGLWYCATGDSRSVVTELPDYDYLNEIRELEKDGRLGEAEQLADWVLDGSVVTNRDEVVARRDAIHEMRTSFQSRAKRILSGFIKGEGTSVDELSGALVSDFLLWGDIRDLAKQGWYKIKGKETDPVIVSLAAVGVVTSVVSYVPDPAEGGEVAADASLSLLKTFKKTGHLSKKFYGVLVDGCRQSVKTKSFTKGMKEIVVGMKNLFDSAGAARAAAIMKHVDDVDSLKAVSKMARHAAEPTAIIVRRHGDEGIKALATLSDRADGAEVLTWAARKGPDGLTKVLSYAKYGARGGKAFRHGHPQKMCKEIARMIGRRPIAILSGLGIMFGLFLMRIWRISRLLGRKGVPKDGRYGQTVQSKTSDFSAPPITKQSASFEGDNE